MSGVGSNVVFEDEKIKVWELNLEPGEQTAVHTHEMDYVFYVINGTTLEVFDADNNLVEPLELNDGDVLPLRLEGDELVAVGNESERVPATHSVRNAGEKTYREIIIEKK
jgi:predicted metal-dependent enzyme (double-stranded beta helix superfamily)